MRQLALDLIARAGPSLDNFVVGPNAEIIAALKAAAAGPVHPPRLHLWGDSASGKTHLLRALDGCALGPDSPVTAFEQAGSQWTAKAPDGAVAAGGSMIAVDDCDQLDDSQQIALFALFNRLPPDGRVRLITASRHAPLALTQLRPELRTRLGSGLVLALRPLSDFEKEQALRDAARSSGVQCTDDVYRYLLTRKSRDLRSLLAAFAELDQYALEKKRPLTAALARESDARREDLFASALQDPPGAGADQGPERTG